MIVVKEGAPETEVTMPLLFSALESTILAKIQEVEKEIKGETGLERLEKLNAILSSLLENLERVRRMGKR